MSTAVVILGAGGRMGQMLVNGVAADEAMTLAGVTERPGREGALSGLGCPVSTDLDELLPKTDGAVIIDFTAPDATMAAVEAAGRHGNPIVIGTTGLTDEQRAVLDEKSKTQPIFLAPNMSVGVNVLLEVLPKLVQALGEAYDIDMVELHHNQKKDAPSGTALKLAECLAEARDWKLNEVAKYCREGIIGARPKKEIGVQTIRGGDVVGVHTMYFMGPGERIEVTHQAHSRETFAAGALRAAKYMYGAKPGKVYAMADVIAD